MPKAPMKSYAGRGGNRIKPQATKSVGSGLKGTMKSSKAATTSYNKRTKPRGK